MAEFKNAEEMLKNYTTHGCFVVAGERPNVMTASWGFFGEMWGKKVAVVPVRDSRFTKGIIDEKQEFTLCVPFGDKYKKELLYCGTKSGRDCDKVKDLCLKITPAKKSEHLRYRRVRGVLRMQGFAGHGFFGTENFAFREKSIRRKARLPQFLLCGNRRRILSVKKGDCEQSLSFLSNQSSFTFSTTSLSKSTGSTKSRGRNFTLL